MNKYKFLVILVSGLVLINSACSSNLVFNGILKTVSTADSGNTYDKEKEMTLIISKVSETEAVLKYRSKDGDEGDFDRTCPIKLKYSEKDNPANQMKDVEIWNVVSNCGHIEYSGTFHISKKDNTLKTNKFRLLFIGGDHKGKIFNYSFDGKR